MNESSTFLETSGTAMATAALATALHSEWINSTDVLVTAVRKGWAGIASRKLCDTGFCISAHVVMMEAALPVFYAVFFCRYCQKWYCSRRLYGYRD